MAESDTPRMIEVIELEDSDADADDIIEVVKNNASTVGNDNTNIEIICVSSDEDDSTERYVLDTVPFVDNRTPVRKTKKISPDKNKQSIKRYRSESSDSSLSSRPDFTNRRLKREDKFHDDKTRYPKSEAVPDYYCRDCQLSLNSELTWKTHLAGQRHYKAIKARDLTKIAMGSIQMPAKPRFASLDQPRFGEPAAGRKRIRVSMEAKLQETVNRVTLYPMPGLNHLYEIYHEKEKEMTYYCKICDAPCDMCSVLKHLTGSRHQLNCLKFVDVDYYKKIQLDESKFRKEDVERILFMDQGKYGKQKIKVFLEKPDKKAKLKPIERLYFDRPGPCWRSDDEMQSESGEPSESSVTAHDKYLDTSKSTFHCTLCNSHMNNMNMWASHVRGERHLKNEKKVPGESLSRVKSVKYDVTPILVGLLKEKARGSVIVGLDFVRETHGPNGVLYNCFLCGAGTTEYDIVDHLLLTKHRIKYLEKMQIDGKDDTIGLIKEMDIGINSRDSLVKEACYRLQQKYGKGRVEVYASKNLFR